MSRVLLFRWNADEAEARAAQLHAVRQSPPSVRVVDLARLPSQGRQLGVWWRAGDRRQTDVRRHGMVAGWVDFKIAAIDADWSGLCFARRSAEG